MRRFVEEADRGQWTLLPERLDDFIDESNPVRVIDLFVDAISDIAPHSASPRMTTSSRQERAYASGRAEADPVSKLHHCPGRDDLAVLVGRKQ